VNQSEHSDKNYELTAHHDENTADNRFR